MSRAPSDFRVVALSTSENSDLDYHALSEPVPLAQANTQPSLQRETFSTSRQFDSCSERELVKQIGNAVDQWPLVIFKEITDKALDAYEEGADGKATLAVVGA